MLTIENIHKLAGKCIGDWKIDSLSLGADVYYIKVLRMDTTFDMYNLMIERRKTKYGDYRIYCFETRKEQYLPIESIRDKDEFIGFIITELT